MDIWTACKDHAPIKPLMGEVLRVVESQEQIATRSLVDDLEEQALLEEMLEHTKPPIPTNSKRLHFLLATPFRYPPLDYGSRFGSRWEPGLFYGAKLPDTALAETAYYRLVFWYGMAQPPPSGHFLTQHTMFAARFSTQHGLRLQAPPFDDYAAVLQHPADYTHTQPLGAAMREAGVAAFEYASARDPAQGINVALFHAKTLTTKQPIHQHPWLCETNGQLVLFNSVESSGVHRFIVEQFLVGGRFPQPGNGYLDLNLPEHDIVSS